MKSYGHINMQQNELQETVLAVETNFPAMPVPGRLVFKDSRLYICISFNSGNPVWIPLTNEINNYEHVQSSSSSVWTIDHNLNTTLPSVQVYGADYRVVFPDDIQIVSNNQVKVKFTRPITGRAVVLTGESAVKAGTDGSVTRPTYSYVHTQTEPSMTWVIDHYLGYQPITRVFIGNEEIQPSMIYHDNNFTTTITFTQPYVGVARLI